MQRSPEFAQLVAALSAAQGEIESATKDAHNPHFGKSYADLASVREVCRIPLSKNGLAIIQSPTVEGVTVKIETLLAHKSGEWLTNDLVMTSAGNTPQAIGSAITYGRRYAMMSLLGIAPEDDDGNLASGRPNIPPPAANQVRPPAPKPSPVAGKPLPQAAGKPAPQAAPKPASAPASAPAQPETPSLTPPTSTTIAPGAEHPAQPAAEEHGDVAAELQKLIEAAQEQRDLDAMIGRFKVLNDAQRAVLRPIYIRRLHELEAKQP